MFLALSALPAEFMMERLVGWKRRHYYFTTKHFQLSMSLLFLSRRFDLCARHSRKVSCNITIHVDISG